MQIILFRHGIAEDRVVVDGERQADAECALSDKGVKRIRLAAAGLSTLVNHVDVVVTSPYRRAKESGEILAGTLSRKNSKPIVREVDELQPGANPEQICAWLREGPEFDTVVLVGHEPGLSVLLAYLCDGGVSPWARFKKAGACLVECLATPRAAGGELVWLMTAAQLRNLSGKDKD